MVKQRLVMPEKQHSDPVIHVGDQNGVSGSWLWTGPALATEAFRGVNQQRDYPSNVVSFPNLSPNESKADPQKLKSLYSFTSCHQPMGCPIPPQLAVGTAPNSNVQGFLSNDHPIN